MRNKKRTLYVIAIVLFASIIILMSIVHCTEKVKKQLSSQVHNSMIDIAQQNQKALEHELQSTHDLLKGLSHELRYRNTHNRTLVIEFLNSYTNIYDFKRMGFMVPSGIAYTTDGHTTALKDITMFEKSFKGQWFVSERIDDFIGEPEAVHVFSVPVYNEAHTKIVGILFATVESEQFEEAFMHDTLDGKSTCIVCSKDGEIITGKDQSEKIYREMNLGELMKQNSPEQIINSGDNYVYYMQVDTLESDNHWYLFTIVPVSILNEQFDPIWYDVQRLLTVIFVVTLFLLTTYVLYYHRQRKLLMQLAYEDTLTKGDNYAYFKEKITMAKLTDGSIVAMDIADFRIINSICGEKTGDLVIQKIWELLSNSVHENEYAAHINADQFIMYFSDEERAVMQTRLNTVKEQIYDLTARMNVPHVEPYFGVCGLDDYEKIEKVHNRAVQARNSIKGRRDVNICFYEDELFQQILDNKQLENRFESAISEKEFEVWYQPKYDTMDGTVVGAEALVRWNMDGQLVTPFKFIPLFEKNGMIAVLDEYVFEHVCRQQKKWQQEGKTLLPISVNISRASLFYREITEKYARIIKEYGISPKYVQLEITESAAVENDDIVSLIDEFHGFGFKLLLDDFGNGYSSLATLNTMKFDVLKIDKSLIDYIGEDNGEELLRHTIELAKYLGLHITAEGVEKSEQITFLQKVKCDDIQGYYFSRPLPESAFEELISVK